MTIARGGLTSYEVGIFVTYLMLTVAVGFFIARRGRADRSIRAGGNIAAAGQ